MNLLVVSPHLDDAVLSVGAYLASAPGPVLTVFDGEPSGVRLTDYDASLGFASSYEAWRARLAENEAALCRLGCDHDGLGLRDRQYGGGRPSPARLAAKIATARVDAGMDGVLGPLGIQHPDHLLAAAACLHLAGYGTPTWLYEDLPYRVVWPELAQERLADVRCRWETVPDALGPPQHEAKAEAVRCYASQRLDEHCCLVPERIWRLVPCG